MREPAWKRREAQRKWQSILAVFIAIILGFAALNGVLKTLTFSRYLGDSHWNINDSFVLSMGTSPPSVFVFQKDPRRMAFMTLDANTNLETGIVGEPIKKLDEIILSGGKDLTRSLTFAFGTKITNYMVFENPKELNQENAEGMFKSFASPLTPIVILISGVNGNVKDTNITRIDMIKLWWQLKSLRTDELKLVDLSPYKQEIITDGNEKVLGVDDVSLNRQIRKYLEDFHISEEDYKVKIINLTGSPRAGQLAYDFATSWGIDKIELEKDDELVVSTTVVSKNSNSKASTYLANIFDCDIKDDGGGGGDEELITVYLGSDFKDKYFQ